MNIAIVVKSFPPDIIGGMETQTKRMASELHERGHEVTVYTKSYGDHDDSDVDYEVVRVRNLRWSPFLSDLTFLFFCLLKLLRRSKEHDVLQCMMFYPVGFLGYVNNRLTGLPYFAWIRGGDYYLMKDVGWKRWMMRRVLKDTLVLAQSEEIKRDVEEDFDDIDTDMDVLGNGVSVPEETAYEDGKGEYVLYVGRLAPKKGVEYLVKAGALLKEQNTEIVLVGDGDERDDLENLADDLDAPVRFEGFVDPEDVDGYYRDAAVFVLPSVEGEGMPNAVLEAMSWGIPVVVTDSGALPSMVQDGENGFILPRGDAGAIAEKVGILLTDTAERKRMGRNAREYTVKNRSWDSVVSSLETTYDRICT